MKLIVTLVAAVGLLSLNACTCPCPKKEACAATCPAGKTAKTCPPGCTKPCCAKKKAQ